MDYYWSEINIFTRWLPSSNQTGILIFDPIDHISIPPWPLTTDKIEIPLLTPDPRQLHDPFWVYYGLLEDVCRLQEKSLSKICDHLRVLETRVSKSGSVPKQEYRKVNDIARHAIHVAEKLDGTAQTVAQIIRQHERHMSSRRNSHSPNATQDIIALEDISRRLSFFQSHIESIRHRSISNTTRIQHELDLAFKILIQYKAALTVDTILTTRLSSSNLKGLSLVIYAFVPPAFFCAAFSMSFFDYNRDLGWAVSGKIWIYFAFIVPTIFMALIWQLWYKHFHIPLPWPKYSPLNLSRHAPALTTSEASGTEMFELMERVVNRR